VTDEQAPHEIWKAMIAEADRQPDSAFAASLTEAIREVVDAIPSQPLAPLIVADPRTATELSEAYLDEWRRRNPEAVA
jgi:hypothetical protein